MKKKTLKLKIIMNNKGKDIMKQIQVAIIEI